MLRARCPSWAISLGSTNKRVDTRMREGTPRGGKKLKDCTTEIIRNCSKGNVGADASSLHGLSGTACRLVLDAFAKWARVGSPEAAPKDLRGHGAPAGRAAKSPQHKSVEQKVCRIQETVPGTMNCRSSEPLEESAVSQHGISSLESKTVSVSSNPAGSLMGTLLAAREPMTMRFLQNRRHWMIGTLIEIRRPLDVVCNLVPLSPSRNSSDTKLCR